MKRHHWLLLALVLGIVLGQVLHPYYEFVKPSIKYFFDPIGKIFLRLIFMVVVPMIFSALVTGVFELRKAHTVGRAAFRTLMFTLITSTASVIIGITLVNVLKPGQGVNLEVGQLSQQTQITDSIKQSAQSSQPIEEIIVNLFTKNPIDAAARAFDGEIIAFMIFALLFGLALSYTAKDNNDIVIKFFEHTLDACMKMVGWAMVLAPLAVFSLVFQSSVAMGPKVLSTVSMYVLTVVLGLAIQQFGVYSLLLKMLTTMSPKFFFSKIKDVMLYAFSTASSNATLPKSLITAEEDLKLHPEISRFVLTIGASANQNGTALFEGITVLFLAQVYGVDLSFMQQLQVIFLSILAGVGTAGVPGGSLPLIALLLTSLGIPAEGLGLILGVDRFLDMCRTTVNVTGDLVIATLVDKKS